MVRKCILLFLLPTMLWAQSVVPAYRVILDPGHGGVDQEPYEIFGDKYDPLSQKYLERFKVGTSSGKNQEKVIVLELGKQVKQILDLTLTKYGFEQFKKYISLFSDQNDPKWIRIRSHLTRRDNAEDRNFRAKDDKNAPYRLYDFPDMRTGKIRLGRISKINQMRPQLVVSLHMNPSYKGFPGGMAAVITPSYRTFWMLKEISEGKKPESTFYNSDWSDWMKFEHGWSTLQNAMSDAWIYFHGYWATKSGKEADLNRFEGYRQNMITWRYKDSSSWIQRAQKAEKGPYAKSHSDFLAQSSFFDRERSEPELWRREDGKEGFGGDNLYAAMELMRFVQYGLRKQLEENGKYPEVGPIHPPYTSTYSLPTFINAISAYLEIGYIDQTKDVEYLTKKKKQVAISLAVGIYSLLVGLPLREEKSMPYTPKGEKLDLEKYENWKGGNYFRMVTDGKN